MLNQSHPGQFKVTNLGHCGITAPAYPGTTQYAALMAGSWDIIVLMLGTNDAKVGTGNLGYFPNCTGAWDTTCSDAAGPNYQQCHADPACNLANTSAAGGHPSPTACSTCMYGTAMHNLIRDMKTVGPAKVGQISAVTMCGDHML